MLKGSSGSRISLTKAFAVVTAILQRNLDVGENLKRSIQMKNWCTSFMQA